MFNTCFVLTLGQLIFGFGLAHAAPVGTTAGGPKVHDPACLELNVASPTQELSKDGKLELSYELRNVCKETVAVNREILPGGNFKLNIISEDGKVSQEPLVRFAYASWKTRQKMGSLPPGEKINATANIMFNAGLYPAGTYKMSGELTMFVFGKGSSATEAVHKLTSNILSLTIK